jgi:hypothetical protein
MPASRKAAWDDPSAEDKPSSFDTLDHNFPKGENDELRIAADALLGAQELGKRCDWCGVRNDARVSIRDAYSLTYVRVCAACIGKSGRDCEPTMTKQETRNLERALERAAEFERLVAQTGFVVRMVDAKPRSQGATSQKAGPR